MSRFKGWAGVLLVVVIAGSVCFGYTARDPETPIPSPSPSFSASLKE